MTSSRFSFAWWLGRPWFPIALLLIALLGVWLGIFGPLPTGATSWLQAWQPLLAATVASIAAYVAFQNTSRSLTHAESLEANRRQRKHAALRAVLPLVLSQVNAYAERSAGILNQFLTECLGPLLPSGTATSAHIESLPSETLKTLAEFIEYTDTGDVGVLESTVAWIQIHDARMRQLVLNNNDPSQSHIVTKTDIWNQMVDAASIYAGASSFFNYARRRDSNFPVTVSWDQVSAALRNMRLWPDENPELHAVIDRREGREPDSNLPLEAIFSSNFPTTGRQASDMILIGKHCRTTRSHSRVLHTREADQTAAGFARKI